MIHPEVVNIFVTPTMAKEWLAEAMPNRNLSRDKVDEYADMMVRGEWRNCEGMPLRFHKGRLHAGQHRIHAVAKSGVSVTFLAKFYDK